MHQIIVPTTIRTGSFQADHENVILTTARWKIPPTRPCSVACSIRQREPVSEVMSSVETNTVTSWFFSSLTFLAWYPVLIPDLDVRTSFLAPFSTNQLASSRPKPPKPPVIMYTLSGLHLAVVMTGLVSGATCLPSKSFSSRILEKKRYQIISQQIQKICSLLFQKVCT